MQNPSETRRRCREARELQPQHLRRQRQGAELKVFREAPEEAIACAALAHHAASRTEETQRDESGGGGAATMPADQRDSVMNQRS